QDGACANGPAGGNQTGDCRYQGTAKANEGSHHRGNPRMARRWPKVVVPIVIDASLTASWHFEDERSEPAEAILESLEHDSAYAPLIWWFEIRNVIILGERNGRTTHDQTAEFVAFLSQLPISLDLLPDSERVI